MSFTNSFLLICKSIQCPESICSDTPGSMIYIQRNIVRVADKMVLKETPKLSHCSKKH